MTETGKGSAMPNFRSGAAAPGGHRDDVAGAVRANLTQTWLNFRLPAAGTASLVALALAAAWRWPPGLVVAVLGAAVSIDAWRRRSAADPSPLVPLLLDTSLVLFAMAVVQLPDSAMGLPYAYTVVAAVLLLSPLRAAPILIYGGVFFLIVQRDVLAWSGAPLTDSQVLVVGVVADLIFFLLLVALVVLTIRELIDETVRSELSAKYEQAIAACSTALLRNADEPLDEALRALLGASDADGIFVEVNETRLGSGLSTRLIREVDRDGTVVASGDDGDAIPWARMQTAHDTLSTGTPFAVVVSDLPMVEAKLYAGSGVVSELDVPVVVEGTWLGVIGFTSRSLVQWADRDRRLLITGAEMIGSHWARSNIRSQLERSVTQLEQRASYQSALAASAEVLLGSEDERGVGEALKALLLATEADYVYIDENYHDPRLGLCTRITHAYERAGSPDIPVVEEWAGGAYSELPTAFAALSRGEPVHIVTSLLEGSEQELYQRDGIKAELCVPIFVHGRWKGSVSFCDYQQERDWTAHELATLQNAARMFGSYTERREATRKLELAVGALDTKLSHETALSRCSEALLRGSDEEAIQTALESLVEATNAHKVFLDENFVDPERGVCARVTHEAIRPGYEEIVDGEIWPDEVTGEMIHMVSEYRRIPSVYAPLRQGLPAIVEVAHLTGAEREFYEEDGCTGEVNIPIVVAGEWVGSIGLALYEEPPDWTDDELRMLGTAAGMIGAFWERNAAHQRLEVLVESKDDLIASVSHELRTPLTATLGLAEMLAEGDLAEGDSETAEFLGLITENSREMAHIVDDLLVAARSDINRLVVASEVVDVREIVYFVTHDKHPALAGPAPEIITEGSTTKAWADPARVRQVVRNLLVNAAKYGGDRVWVVLGASGNAITVAVCDDGEGVDPESERAIFDAFQRAHERSTQPRSLGLGLTVSRRLARLMGGELEYRRMPSQTAFVLTLPRPEA
jgi:signal transduction histidine kinase/putative methionine-R-sulfoxide reductase with GAF domain